jgi:hypothetical protein
MELETKLGLFVVVHIVNQLDSLLTKKIDSNRMSQMNVFQGLRHPYIPNNYIRNIRLRGTAK